MGIPHKLQDLLLYSIVLFGGLSFVGAIGITANVIKPIWPYIKFSYFAEYSATSASDLEPIRSAKICFSVLILSAVFAIALVVFWILGRPTSSISISWLFRVLIFICCLGETVILVVAYSDTHAPLKQKLPDQADIDQEKYTKQRADLMKWLSDNYPEKRDSNDNIIDSMDQWNDDLELKISQITYLYYCFMCTDFFFDGLVVIYWMGFLYCNWFSGGSSPKVANDNEDVPKP